MSTTRRFFVGLCAFCLLTFCAAILRGCWYGIHHQRGNALLMLVTALLVFWVGSAIATVLKNNPEE